MQKSHKLSVAMTSTAAVLFSTAPLTVSTANAAKIKCEGANGCKGQSSCHTAVSGCQGQNSCKGKGFLMLTKTDCDAALAKMKSGKK